MAVDVIYHSHIDAGAYFSATDKQNALMNGEPFYPDGDVRGRLRDGGQGGRYPGLRLAPAAAGFVECPM